MPLILSLLQHLRRLQPVWEGQLAAETRLIARARSLYLVRWFFVEDLPLRGDRIGVWFTNLVSLRARLRGGRRDGASLLAPAAGLAAGLGAAFTSPGVTPALAKLTGSRLLETLNALTHGLLISAGAAVGGSIGFAHLLPSNAGALDGLGRAAEALEQIVARPVHPLVRGAVGLGDRLAGLGTQLLGAFAVLATRVGPRLMPMALQAAAIKAIVLTLVEMVSVTLANTLAHLQASLTGPHGMFGIAGQVFDALGTTFARVGDQLEGAWRAILDVLVKQGSDSQTALTAWWGTVQGELLAVIPKQVLEAIGDRLGAIAAVIEHWKPIDTTRGFLDDLLDELAAPFGAAVKPLAGLAFPTPGEFRTPTATLPERWLSSIKGIANAPFHRPIVAPAYRSSQVFAGRLAALPAPDRTPLRTGIAELQAYQALAERAVAPGALEVVPGLLDLMVKLDDRREHPVKALPEDRVLAPRVGKLRIRGASGEQAAAFGESLRGALARQAYLVPAGS